MKSLVIFYSLEGNTRAIACAIAQAVQGELLELKPKKEISSKGFLKFVWGGRQAMMKKEPELCSFSIDSTMYDCMFIGTPVWAWTFSPPLRSFFSQVSIENKKIALFCCHGGGKGKIFQTMQEQLAGNTIIGTIDFNEPLKRGKEAAEIKAQNWAKNIASELA